MSKIARVGVDLAKNLIQVHAVDETGKVVSTRVLKRERFIAWCVDLPQGCLVAMEACSGVRGYPGRCGGAWGCTNLQSR